MATEITTRRQLELGTHCLSYLEAGDPDAPSIVLCHGGGFDAAMVSWRSIIPRLAETHHVIAPDWPGFGESASPPFEPSLDFYVETLGNVREQLTLDAPVLCGVSMGGAIAIGDALANPEQVRKLIAIDSYGLGSAVPGGHLSTTLVHTPAFDWLWSAIAQNRQLAAASVRFAVHPANRSEALLEDVLTELKRSDATKAWQSVQRKELRGGTLQTDYRDRLGELSMPVCYVHGEEDRLVPVDWSRRAHRLTPESELTVFSPCGHWTPRERPDSLIETLESFLGTATANRGE
ncbi:alpha/beta fold hydrolase [Halocatena halophila]|uniref:alpha/beta fold hydrolase n=1 Tax=Halocatena halophila TaxID=2814576 RepID=UPI002ED2A3F5